MKVSENKKDYPYWAHPTKREWLKDVRKRWNEFKRVRHPYKRSVMSGSAYYPKEVYQWLIKSERELKKMDLLMREYYKNA